MHAKTKIGFVRDAVDPVLLQDIQDKMIEKFGTEAIEFVELGTPFGYGASPLDVFAPAPHELERLICISIRRSFRDVYSDRIDRHNRVWPRVSAPILQWHRKVKWLPRLHDASRRSYFSQSQLRQSQVLSWRSVPDIPQHTVCSLEDLDLSRWP